MVALPALCGVVSVLCSYWRVTLLSAKVSSIKAASAPSAQDGSGAVYTIGAVVHEDGQLMDGAGATRDVYNTQYRVQYDVVRGADGSWRIVDADDL